MVDTHQNGVPLLCKPVDLEMTADVSHINWGATIPCFSAMGRWSQKWPNLSFVIPVNLGCSIYDDPCLPGTPDGNTYTSPDRQYIHCEICDLLKLFRRKFTFPQPKSNSCMANGIRTPNLDFHKAFARQTKFGSRLPQPIRKLI